MVKLRYLSAAISINMFCSTLNLSVIASEPEHLCYLVTQSNKILDLSSACPFQKKKPRSIKKHSTEVKANKSGIQPPNFSHYLPPKFRMDKLKQE